MTKKAKKGTTETFTVKLNNGEEVNVKWHKKWLGHPLVDHLELRGPMTSTGYRSEFIHKKSDKDLDREEVIEYCRNLAQKLWEENEEKYGKQLSFDLA